MVNWSGSRFGTDLADSRHIRGGLMGDLPDSIGC